MGLVIYFGLGIIWSVYAAHHQWDYIKDVGDEEMLFIALGVACIIIGWPLYLTYLVLIYLRNRSK